MNLKKLGKKEKKKRKEEENSKDTNKINKIENDHIVEINKVKSLKRLFMSPWWVLRKKEKIKVAKVKNEKGALTTDLIDIRRTL